MTTIACKVQRYLIFVAVQISIALFLSGQVVAGPMLPAGDTMLRHDIQLLADRGLITGPVTSWPLSWGPVLAQIRDVVRLQGYPRDVAAAIERVHARAQWETRSNAVTYSARASAAEAPRRIRSFQATPRESAEIGAGLSYTGNRVSVTLRGQAADSSNGRDDAHADGSMVGIALGNFSVSVNTLDRWWGPGWDGSLILSNNARPIPSISLDRNFTDPFDNNWLRWLGPWDLAVMVGQLESRREIPNALFLGMRFNFKPVASLEIGLSRTAQWCGDGRPCKFSTFTDLVLGNDNLGGGGINAENEPGNQLAGVDFRWSPIVFDRPLSIYGQFVGEDEAGGFPSRYIGQIGVETSGIVRNTWSWRWFGEFAGTTCQFHESSEIFNCAYNHTVYRTGYRYRGQSIGHGADNDARLISTGVFLVDDNESQWQLLMRTGTLNRGGSPDARNSLTSVPQEIGSIDISHSRVFRYGVVELGAGFEALDSSAGKVEDTRFYIQWRSAY